MKLTLATCALGALGLTPALYGSHGEPKPQQPLKPVPPAAPVAAPAPVAHAPVALAPAGGAWLPQPESPARLYVSALREQTGNEDLARDAERLQKEIKRLRGELKAMQKDLKKSNSKKKSKSKSSGKAVAERKELEELQGRLAEERHRMEERREEVEERRAELEERRGQAKVLVKGRLQKADVQDALAEARVLVGKSKDGKSFEWSGKDGADVKVFMFDGDDDGHKRVFKHVNSTIWGQAPQGGAQGQAGSKIGVGGPNTFHIHVEEGDVHIHTNGASSITTTTSKTSRSKSAPTSAAKDLFGRLQHGGPSHDAGDTMSFFAKVVAEDGEEPTFELNFNGQEIELDNLEEIIGAVGESASGMALEGLLSGLEGLEGLEDIDVDFDFDFDFEGDDECDDECDEDEESEEGSDRDERFVRMFPAAPSVNPVTARWNATKAWPARVVQPASFRLSGGQPAPVAVTAEEELLRLAREIQADVQAMRAELDELREEVRSAPTRAPSRR